MMKSLFSSALLRTQSDERLVTLVAAGHERAFETIVQRYGSPLERYCARALSPSEAEDVVQQVLLKAWTALSRGNEVRSLRPWLFRIAQTTIIQTVQKSGFDYDELERSLSPLDGPDSELEKRAFIRKTLIGLAALPEAQREALLRTAVDGESRAEIAQALGVSEGAVRQLLHRARASLRSVATAVTPVPLVVWITRPAEVAGAGLAQVSAIVASAGVVAAGPIAVRELSHQQPAKARVPVERPVSSQPGAQVAASDQLDAKPSHRATAPAASKGKGAEGTGRKRTRRESSQRDDSSSRAEPAPDDAREQAHAFDDADDEAGKSGSANKKRARKRGQRQARDRMTDAAKQARGHRGDESKASKQPQEDARQTSHSARSSESDGQDGDNDRKDQVKAPSG